MGNEAPRARKRGRTQEMPPTKWWFLVVGPVVGYFVIILLMLMLFLVLTLGLGLGLLLEFPLEAITLVAILALPVAFYFWWTSRRDRLRELGERPN